MPVLPGFHVRALRQSARGPTEGDNPVLSAIPVRCRQALRGESGASPLSPFLAALEPTENDGSNRTLTSTLNRQYWIVVNYRESYGMHCSNGVLFNHESPRRGETFVTRKITRAVAKIHLGLQKELVLGNLDSKRDWGHARDYIRMMHMMLQQDSADDYVVATNEAHSVREFVEAAFGHVGVKLRWEGKAENEVGIDVASGDVKVRVSPKYYRPAEVEFLLGDATKAKEKLGWQPEIKFEELCKEMVEADIALMKANPNA